MMWCLAALDVVLVTGCAGYAKKERPGSSHWMARPSCTRRLTRMCPAKVANRIYSSEKKESPLACACGLQDI